MGGGLCDGDPLALRENAQLVGIRYRVVTVDVMTVRIDGRDRVHAALEVERKAKEEVIERYETTQETKDKILKKYHNLDERRRSSPSDTLNSCILSNDPLLEDCD